MTYRQSLLNQQLNRLRNHIKGEHNLRRDRNSGAKTSGYRHSDNFPDLIGNSDKK